MINIGQVMKDGSLYAGHHPVHTNQFLLCKEKDEPETMTWDDAMSIEGPFKLPTLEELTVLFAYRPRLGFGIGCDWYWSSSEYNSHDVWLQFFTIGIQNHAYKYHIHHVRLVRTVTQEELKALI